MAKRWTIARLNRQLRKLMASGKVSIEDAVLPDCTADAHWDKPDGEIFIRVDTERWLAKCAIHELLHHVLQHDLMAKFTYEVEEPQIQALEDELWKKIGANQRVLAWWRNRVRQAMAEEE